MNPMSTWTNNLFSFNRELPAPYDKVTSKKLRNVHSMHGASTEATLCSTVIKAVHAVLRCMDGTGKGAVGCFGSKTVAEYKSATGPDDYHLVVYDSTTGAVRASVYNTDTEVIETYTMNSAARDGAAVMMAMLPTMMQDKEFSTAFEEYRKEYDTGLSNFTHATEVMALLCDNAYRRVKDDTCPAHVKIEVDKSGNIMHISQTQLISGAYTPTTVFAGEFSVFANTSRDEPVKAAEILVQKEDFEGKYRFGKRKFGREEEKLIPKLPDWYVIPQEVVDICKHALATTGRPTQMRNFMLRGPAGNR